MGIYGTMRKIHWRPTRLEAWDQSSGSHAIVESYCSGWRWVVYRGSHHWNGQSGSKDQAIEEALASMQKPYPPG